MNDDTQDNFTARVTEVQRQLEDRVGAENAQAIVSAISAQGFTPDFLRNVLISDDAAANFVTLGQQSLLNVMQAGSPNDADVRKAEEVYSTLRSKERDAWKAARGRR
jgi:hypothetical protein